MTSTLEKLPDEILMIIFQYSGDVFNILRTFLGLNQRLNNILLDKRLHLLTDFLLINVRNDYYNSEIFQQITQQLLRIDTIVDEEKLSQLFQPLLSSHIKQKYIEILVYRPLIMLLLENHNFFATTKDKPLRRSDAVMR